MSVQKPDHHEECRNSMKSVLKTQHLLRVHEELAALTIVRCVEFHALSPFPVPSPALPPFSSRFASV